MTCKNTVFLRDIIFEHLPELFPTKSSRQLALKTPKAFNVEHLVEIALERASTGSYEFVDRDGYDFTDFSDSKTATISSSEQRCTVNSLENKIGAIRLCVYNGYRDKVDYFFFDTDAVSRLGEPSYGKHAYKVRMRSGYNVYADTYSKFEPYRVATFSELATRMEDGAKIDTAPKTFSTFFAVSS